MRWSAASDPAAETDELWRRLGEAEYQAGRSLEDLRAAFRTGIRAAWRGAAELATAAGVSAPVTIALAEAIFVYGDELATDVVEGYLRIQSDEAGERERRRRRLAPLLLDPAGHDPEALARAAELARWPVPRALAVVALADDDPVAVARRLDLDVAGRSRRAGARGWCCPIPTGPGRRAALEHAVGRRAGGPRSRPSRPPMPTARCDGRGSRSSSCARERYRRRLVRDHRPPGDGDPAPGRRDRRALVRSGWRRSTSCRRPSASA